MAATDTVSLSDRGPSARDVLRIRARNMHALIVRDMMMRYGRDNIGFVWIILEPMILTAGVMIIWTLTMGSDKHGVKMVEFVMTGYMPLTLWRHLTNNSLMLFRRSVSLLYHRNVSLFDIMASKIVVEMIGTTGALLVVWGSLNILGLVNDVYDFYLLLLGWLMMGWLGSACALILAAMTEYSEASERFVQPIQYLMIPISGAFALTDWLPDWAQKFLLLNPMVHCYEVFRGGFFGPIITVHYELAYFSACTFALTFVGIVAVKKVRKHVQIS